MMVVPVIDWGGNPFQQNERVGKMYNFTIYRNGKFLRTVQVSASNINIAMSNVFDYYAAQVNDKAICGNWVAICLSPWHYKIIESDN